MASPKTNIRSFRFSDDVLKILTNYRGENLNCKFENLIFDAFGMVEERQQQLEQINRMIEEKRKTLMNLQRATDSLTMLEKDLESAKRYFQIVERRAKEISESTM